MSEGNQQAELTALRSQVQEQAGQIELLLGLGNIAATNITNLARAMSQMLDRLRALETRSGEQKAELAALAFIQRAGRRESARYDPMAQLPAAISPFIPEGRVIAAQGGPFTVVAGGGKPIPPGVDIPL